MSAYVCMCTNAWHRACVEARGQFARVGSLFWGWNSSQQAPLPTEPFRWPLKLLQGLLIDLFKTAFNRYIWFFCSIYKENGGLGRLGWDLGFQLQQGLVPRLARRLGSSGTTPTSRLEMSMSTAQLAEWLHWQVTWVRFLDSSSQPLADHPPLPPMLWRRGRG